MVVPGTNEHESKTRPLAGRLALATVGLFLLAATSLGAVCGGMFHLVGAGVSATAQAAGALAPMAGEAAKLAGDAASKLVPQFDWKSVKYEAQRLLRDTRKPELQPEALAGDAEKLKHEGKKTAQQAAAHPEFGNEEVGELLQKAYGVVRGTMNAADREALVNVIVSRAGITKEAAEKGLEKVEKTYADAKQKFQTAAAEAERQARVAANDAKNAMAQVAVWGFLSLALGMAAAAFGGHMGSVYMKVT